MIAWSLPYAYCIAYFLEKVVGMSEMQMLKKRGARTIPMGRRSGGVVTFAVAGVTVKLRLPTNSMIKQTMHLPGSNRSNCQKQAALNAVTDITKESVWFIIIYCFFTVDTVKVLQYRL